MDTHNVLFMFRMTVFQRRAVMMCQVLAVRTRQWRLRKEEDLEALLLALSKYVVYV